MISQRGERGSPVAIGVLAVVDEYVGMSNANAHLRAGLGRPMQVLLPLPAEFRWGIEGDRSPWFPAMRLHRQATSGDWSEALQGLRAAL